MNTQKQWEDLANEAIRDAGEWKARATTYRNALRRLLNCPDLQLESLEDETVSAIEHGEAALRV